MKKNILKVTLVAAFALIAGYNVYTSQKSDVEMSDLALANVEALADGRETSDEFTKSTCCVAVWEDVSCEGCDGHTHSHAKHV